MKDLTRDPEALTRVVYSDGLVRLFTSGVRRWVALGMGDTELEAIDAARRELRDRLADLDRAFQYQTSGSISPASATEPTSSPARALGNAAPVPPSSDPDTSGGTPA